MSFSLNENSASINQTQEEILIEEEQDPDYQILETLHAEDEIQDNRTIGQKKSCIEVLEEYSMFGIRFGVFIINSTRFTNKLAVIASIITFIILCWIILANLLEINSIDFCCNVIHINQRNETDEEYNVQTPFGPETWIDDNDNPRNTSLLFPIEFAAKGLTCSDLNLSMVG